MNLAEIFGMGGQGSIFQVKNVGGLITADTKTALIYALKHLDPQIIVIVHHTKCGGYQTLFKDRKDVEPEIYEHLMKHGAYLAKHRVEEYIQDNKIDVSNELIERMVIEEGARTQKDYLLYFFKRYYPELYLKIKKEDVLLLAAIYDLETRELNLIPKQLEGSEILDRENMCDWMKDICRIKQA